MSSVYDTSSVTVCLLLRSDMSTNVNSCMHNRQEAQLKQGLADRTAPYT